MVKTDFGGEGGVKQSKGRNWQRILLPVVGLLLITASGIIAYILSTPVANFLRANLAAFPRENTQAVQLAVAFAIFLILIAIFGTIYASIVPKPPKGITETELDKEKKDKLLEAERAKRRKRDMKNRMREQRKK
ncbi:MAG: hypothetical protein MUE40_17755 [Anaerolineae bacterium]|jgi:hypothetical protein|nr:hypothetical protein [Anaerolineae bacterium]